MKKLLLGTMFLLSAGILAGCTTSPQSSLTVTSSGNLQAASGTAVSSTGGEFVNTSGMVVYSGDVKDSVQNGIGISFTDDGKLEYKGQWQDGKAEGTGTLYYGNGQAAYIGQRHEGHPEGRGTWYYMNGQIAYQGWFHEGDPEGTGTLYDMSGSIIYQGNRNAHKIDLKNIKIKSPNTSGFLDKDGNVRVNILFNHHDDNDNVKADASGKGDIRTDDNDNEIGIFGRGNFHGRDNNHDNGSDNDKSDNSDHQDMHSDNGSEIKGSLENDMKGAIDLHK